MVVVVVGPCGRDQLRQRRFCARRRCRTANRPPCSSTPVPATIHCTLCPPRVGPQPGVRRGAFAAGPGCVFARACACSRVRACVCMRACARMQHLSLCCGGLEQRVCTVIRRGCVCASHTNPELRAGLAEGCPATTCIREPTMPRARKCSCVQCVCTLACMCVRPAYVHGHVCLR